MMQLLAPIENIRFDIEDVLEKQVSIVPLPFDGMDKSASSVCESYVRSSCKYGNRCPYRHVKGDKSVVCKHWLRGLCKKGDECEFLHEYDMSKMPECFFYSKYSQCGNKECEYLHLDRESKIKDCPWYDRGFCRHGPNCKNRHVKKLICQNYLFGFCPDGPNCKLKHPKFDLPTLDTTNLQKKPIFICDYCGEKGHKVTSCFKLNPEHRQAYQAKMRDSFLHHDLNHSHESDKRDENDLERSDSSMDTHKENVRFPHHHQPNFNPNRGNYHQPMSHQFHHNQHQANQPHRVPLPPSEVTCFKCNEKGHYANKCNKGVFAFLRSQNDK